MLVFLLLVLSVFLLLRLGVLRRISDWLAQHRSAAAGPRPLPKTVRVGKAVGGPRARPLAQPGLHNQLLQLWRSRGRSGQAILIAILCFVVVLLLRLVPAAGAPRQREHLVIAVAPFLEEGGEQVGTGAAVARDLVSRLQTDPRYRLNQPIELILLAEPVADVPAAVRQADAGFYDALIWGRVAPGALVDSPSLRPQLLFIPRQPALPERWPAGRQRLALPAAYELSRGPINGLAVLGPLLDALDLYQQGHASDSVVELLTDLRLRYGEQLSPKLPATLLGTLRWAQQDLNAAGALFHEALEAAPDDPLLWNNLGVVLQDQGDTAGAAAAFARSQALAQQQGGDLAAPYFNRGLGLLGDPDPQPALQALQRANELRRDEPTLLLALARAQRRAGDLHAAALSLQQAQGLAPDDLAVIQEALLQRFSQLAGDGAHIEWGLELRSQVQLEQLSQLRTDLSALVASLEGRVLAEQQAAAREDVRQNLEAGRLHEAMARRIEGQLNEARYWEALAALEEGRQLAQVDKSTLASLWDALRGVVSPLEQAQQNLAALAERTGSYSSRYQQGRAFKFMGLGDLAREQFQQASEQEPQRPEAFYGLATLLWNEQRPGQERDDQLRDLLRRAIDADGGFYPARTMLAELEVQTGQWQAALEQLDWLTSRPPEQPALQVERGRVLTRLQRYAEAEQQLLPLANAGNVEAMVALAELYLAGEHEQAAEEVLSRALQANPGHTGAAYTYAQLLHRQGRETDAARVLEQALSHNPGSMEAHLLLGDLYAGPLNQPGRAITHYQRAIEAGGSDPRNYETLGQLLLEAGQPEQAVEALSRAIELEPNAAEPYHLLGRAYIALDRYQEARQAEQTALERAPEQRYPEALAGIGDSYRLEGQFEQAVEFYSRALEQNPELITAYIGLGRTAAAQNQWQVAIGHYQQALEREPANPEAHYWLATGLLESGNNESALREFQSVLQQNPDFVEAYYGAGRALVAMGRTEEATGQFEEALRRRPTYAEALLARGKLLEAQGLQDAALADYQAAAVANPRLAEPLYLQGRIALGRNDFPGAIAALEEAVRRQENLAEAHYWLGRAYRAQERRAEALNHFRRAVELQPSYSEAHYFRALAEEELGNRAEAIVAYELFLSQAGANSPWHGDAQRALERLR